MKGVHDEGNDVGLMRMLSRHKVLTRVVSMVLVLTLLFYVIPSVVYAEVADAIAEIGQGGATRGAAAPYPKIKIFP